VIAHLWQSTVFALAAGLLALVLRPNRAKVRYQVWLVASAKFLIPFALLVELGSHLAWRHSADVTPMQVITPAIEEPASSPILPPPPQAATATRSARWNPAVLYAVWAAGTLLVAGRWWIEWRSIRRAVRAAAPLDLTLPIQAVSSRDFAEPGVFGIFRPVLLLPEGIQEQLSIAQFDSMIAHERAHLRRRDNLATALHMAVEAAFWFHPLVWWIGGRLLEERERACDEEVLRSGSAAKEYAEGILRVCELYLVSPRSVSGITGSNLKRRIEQIVSGSVAVGLSAAKKSALAAAGAAAVLAPLLVGFWNAPAIPAQTDRPAVKFEVASVKACSSAGDDGGGRGG
jgi:bla regulator protein BlaR1